MQNVAWPTTIANRPSGSDVVENVVLSPTPGTMPGGAIGSRMTNEIPSRPRKPYRAIARETSVPRSTARAVAPSAATTDVRNASRRPLFAIASPIQRNEKPLGGHADVPFELNA